eukprot:TRINITY_DN211_c0_g1_i2.p1 TRINITY_DN211_c0_g1~~TRINITY_DN211_c0_g1_i2.p1  ORF type:complete len:116 (-),score=10.07 TRINITY_DN211_c0_g1_i2:265-612(-)
MKAYYYAGKNLCQGCYVAEKRAATKSADVNLGCKRALEEVDCPTPKRPMRASAVCHEPTTPSPISSAKKGSHIVLIMTRNAREHARAKKNQSSVDRLRGAAHVRARQRQGWLPLS